MMTPEELEDYVEGMGCLDGAWNADECACVGVDWTPKEVYELRAEVARLNKIIGELKT